MNGKVRTSLFVNMNLEDVEAFNTGLEIRLSEGHPEYNNACGDPYQSIVVNADKTISVQCSRCKNDSCPVHPTAVHVQLDANVLLNALLSQCKSSHQTIVNNNYGSIELETFTDTKIDPEHCQIFDNQFCYLREPTTFYDYVSGKQYDETSFIKYNKGYFTKVPTDNERKKFAKVESAKLWMNSPNLPRYENIVVHPGAPRVISHPHPDKFPYLNVWKRGGALPNPNGDCSKWYELLDMLCDYDADTANYLKDIFAWKLQNPQEKMDIALQMFGNYGTGKSELITQYATALYGSPTTPNGSFAICNGAVASSFAEKYNGHLVNKEVIFIDELDKAADWVKKKMKKDITDKYMNVRRMRDEWETVKTNVFFIFVGNALPISLDKDDRRYVVLNVADHLHKKPGFNGGDFIAQLKRDMDNAGAGKLVFDLMNRPVDFNPRDLSKLPDKLRYTREKLLQGDDDLMTLQLEKEKDEEMFFAKLGEYVTSMQETSKISRGPHRSRPDTWIFYEADLNNAGIKYISITNLMQLYETHRKKGLSLSNKEFSARLSKLGLMKWYTFKQKQNHLFFVGFKVMYAELEKIFAANCVHEHV